MLAFTGHHVVATGVDEDEARSHLDSQDIAAPFNPVFLSWLGHRLDARVGHIDVTLARLGSGLGDDRLEAVAEPPDNERVRRARQLRSEVTFFMPADRSAVVALGVGLAGRRELSIEISDEVDRSKGLGTGIVVAAVARVRVGEAIFASVAPGNTRSLRCFLNAGFSPIGAECILSAG